MSHEERPEPQALMLALVFQRHALMAYVDRQMPAALRSTVDPADVVQDVSVEALRHARSFDPAIDPTGRRWLFTIARRRLTRLLERHHASRQRNEAAMAADSDASIALLEQLAVYERTPSESAIDHEWAATLKQALAELTPDHADVIRSRYIDRLPASAVADRIGRSPAAVDKLLQRAVAALAVQLRRLRLVD